VIVQHVRNTHTSFWPLFQSLSDPVFAIILAKQLRQVAFFNAIDTFPGFNLLTDFVRAELQLDVCRRQPVDIRMLQIYPQLYVVVGYGVQIQRLTPTGIPMRRVLAVFVGAVAVVAGRRKVAEIDGVEGIKPPGKVMVIRIPLAVMQCIDITNAAKRAFPGAVRFHECLVVINDLANLVSQRCNVEKGIEIFEK
jgi:hypothetical protein